MLYVAAVFLPLLAFLIAGVLGPRFGDRFAQYVTSGGTGLAALCAIVVLFEVVGQGQPRTVELFTWVDVGAFEFSWALRFDVLSAVMVSTVTIISTLIHVYSIGYMHHDPSVPRFMSYLSLFTFFMLMLVTADNLVQLFFGWEGVGLASYLLIGFWFQKPTANAAAIKAFVINRVGDLGFALGIFGVFLLFNSVEFDTIFAAVADRQDATITFLGGEFHALTVLCLLLFIGAMGKSAQLGLHTWLPDAMEGPTPVSALIHAATMVTAGVFMVARLSPLFEYAPVALAVVAIVGASTAFFAATVGCVQNDIKRVIAYSTCSQLGYMFFAIGVSAYPAAIFHLVTHAYFKALLFLGSGSVIHAMSDEQDMRKMGGIWRMVPVTYAVMWIGSLALAGVPLFAGYYSKDLIIESAFAAGTPVGDYAFAMGVIAAFLTAFYSWRLLIMTFHGQPRADEHVMAHVHESPKVMLVPLIMLAIGAIFAGVILAEPMTGHHWREFWHGSIVIVEGNDAMELAHDSPLWVKLLPVVVALAGIGLAYLFYMFRPDLPGAVRERFQGLYRFLLNKWYFDELYDALFVRTAFSLGRGLWKSGDGAVIDGCGPDGIASASRSIGQQAARLQSGYLYHYAFAMLIGVVLLVSWYLFQHIGAGQ